MGLAGCAGTPSGTADAETPEPTAASGGHGEVSGAAEMSEPQSRLLSVSSSGEVGLVDLLTEEDQSLGEIGSPTGIASDGRFAFVEVDSGLDVVDGGAWTWDHGDHFHYYRADPAIVGSLPGDGPATIVTPQLATVGTTGVFFAGSGEAVALDMATLADGEIAERFRLDTDATAGVVAPVGELTIIALADGSDAGIARVHDASGEIVGGAEEECTDPSGGITTRVGTLIGCADGALLATEDDGSIAFDRIEASADGAPATDFGGRKNRPTVAALSGSDGFWLLDTRAETMRRVAVDAELTQVVAADDADEHVVALDAQGRVRVFGPDGTELGATEPIADEGSTLTVDTTRAYVSSPEAGVVYEIDFADGARIAREIETPTALAVAIEVGR
ncbi:ABC transporter [Microbacterium karelineae]|uniref:ABC transporter n=1 Tax=Microbacterium karelineae TaxID=2654283 RepID=UPI0012EA8F44|nr:ABC transporter [Microbacterium karelineae]